QIDLENSKNSGLIQVQTLLKDIDGISFVNFNEKDIVRHDLVKYIIKAYSQNEFKTD
ncbi:MAG TPA: PhoH family protein, partial [Nitrospinaceae bacterium]|nr:PhoH family protein [Nitrospinaceae bacterium]